MFGFNAPILKEIKEQYIFLTPHPPFATRPIMPKSGGEFFPPKNSPIETITDKDDLY